jgi:hypothetical protein
VRTALRHFKDIYEWLCQRTRLRGQFCRQLGLDDVPNLRSFHEGEFLGKTTLKQHADAIVAGQVGRRNQGHVLANAEVNQVAGLGQDEKVSEL